MQTKLSEIAHIKSGYAFKSNTYVSSGYRVIRITNVQKGYVVDDDPKFISIELAKNLSNYHIKDGDILISLTGNVGRVAVINPSLQPAILNQRVGLIRVVSKNVYPPYIFYLLNSQKFEQEAIKNANGIAQLNLSTKWLSQYEVFLPDMNTQKDTAYLLSKVEELISKRKQSIQQLDELIKSIFNKMFGENAVGYKEWPIDSIQNLAKKNKGAVRTGPFGSNLLHKEFQLKGDVAVLGIDNAVKNKFTWGEPRYISLEKYKELENYRVYPNDVIITIMGTVGRSAVIPNDIPLAINTKHLAAITLDLEKANPNFISFCIHSNPSVINQFKRKNRGAIMNGLNLTIIKETKIKRPPIELQNKFALVLQVANKIESLLYQNLNQLENLYNALSQKAFKGELDLSKVASVVDLDLDNAQEALPKNLHLASQLTNKLFRKEISLSRLISFQNRLPKIDNRYLKVARLTANLPKIPNEILDSAQALNRVFKSNKHIINIPDYQSYQKSLDNDDGEFEQSIAIYQPKEQDIMALFTVNNILSFDQIVSQLGLEGELNLTSYDFLKNTLYQLLKNNKIKQTEGKITVTEGDKEKIYRVLKFQKVST